MPRATRRAAAALTDLPATDTNLQLVAGPPGAALKADAAEAPPAVRQVAPTPATAAAPDADGKENGGAPAVKENDAGAHPFAAKKGVYSRRAGRAAPGSACAAAAASPSAADGPASVAASPAVSNKGPAAGSDGSGSMADAASVPASPEEEDVSVASSKGPSPAAAAPLGAASGAASGAARGRRRQADGGPRAAGGSYTWLHLARPPRRSNIFEAAGAGGSLLAPGGASAPTGARRTFLRRAARAPAAGASAAELSAYIDERRAYFADVDAFDLAEEEEGAVGLTPARGISLSAISDARRPRAADGAGGESGGKALTLGDRPAAAHADAALAARLRAASAAGGPAPASLAEALESDVDYLGEGIDRVHGSGARRLSSGGRGPSLSRGRLSGGSGAAASLWPSRLWQWAEATVDAWAGGGLPPPPALSGRESTGSRGGRASDAGPPPAGGAPASRLSQQLSRTAEWVGALPPLHEGAGDAGAAADEEAAAAAAEAGEGADAAPALLPRASLGGPAAARLSRASLGAAPAPGRLSAAAGSLPLRESLAGWPEGEAPHALAAVGELEEEASGGEPLNAHPGRPSDARRISAVPAAAGRQRMSLGGSRRISLAILPGPAADDPAHGGQGSALGVAQVAVRPALARGSLGLYRRASLAIQPLAAPADEADATASAAVAAMGRLSLAPAAAGLIHDESGATEAAAVHAEAPVTAEADAEAAEGEDDVNDVDDVVVQVSALQALLIECGQGSALGASAGAAAGAGAGGEELEGLDALLTQFARGPKDVRKLGEGTFGEAFRAEKKPLAAAAAAPSKKGGKKGAAAAIAPTADAAAQGAADAAGSGAVVLKVVPMDGNVRVNGEIQRTAADYLGEAVIANRLSALGDSLRAGGPAGSGHQHAHHHAANATLGFVRCHRVAVCRGAYAPWLTQAWEAWDAAHGSENDHPRIFPRDQLYTVFVVADGGQDLEHFELRDFAEARALLLQVALALAVGEEACGFEHRDLHWGNVLVQRGRPQAAPAALGADADADADEEGYVRATLRGQRLRAAAGGISVTLIDFSLSRLEAPGLGALHFNLESDPELFMGPAKDCQAETYRRMRKLTKGDWAGYHAGTNALWLSYLADVLLEKKAFAASVAEKRELRGFRTRARAGESAAALLWDGLFAGAWTVEQGDAGGAAA